MSEQQNKKSAHDSPALKFLRERWALVGSGRKIPDTLIARFEDSAGLYFSENNVHDATYVAWVDSLCANTRLIMTCDDIYFAAPLIEQLQFDKFKFLIVSLLLIIVLLLVTCTSIVIYKNIEVSKIDAGAFDMSMTTVNNKTKYYVLNIKDMLTHCRSGQVLKVDDKFVCKSYDSNFFVFMNN